MGIGSVIKHQLLAEHYPMEAADFETQILA